LRYFNASGAAADGSIGEDHHPETHLIPLVVQAATKKRAHVEVFGTDYPTADGTCVRDYIHVEDLAEAHTLALEKTELSQFRAFNLGTGRGYSVREVIQTVEKVTGLPVPVKVGPRRPGDPPELIAHPAKAMKELGWRPRYVELEDIVRTAWTWHRTYPDGFRN
jgi:UDP-glucose 4-epimerase